MQTLDPKVTIAGITFNDYSVYGQCYSCNTVPDMLSAPPPRASQSPRQGQHGVYDPLSWYGPRRLPFSGELVAPDAADRLQMEWDLKAALSLSALQDFVTDDGQILVSFELEDGSLLQCYAKIASGVDFFYRQDSVGRHQIRGFSFVLLAKDPRLYSQTLQSETGGETYQGTNFKVVEGSKPKVPFKLYTVTPASVTCDNAGSYDAPPVITINGPTTSPRVTNVTTGRFIELTGLTLAEGESAVIDVAAGTVEDAEGENLSAYWGSGSSWWVLRRGENAITLLDSTPSEVDATIQVQWRDTYL